MRRAKGIIMVPEKQMCIRDRMWIWWKIRRTSWTEARVNLKILWEISRKEVATINGHQEV